MKSKPIILCLSIFGLTACSTIDPYSAAKLDKSIYSDPSHLNRLDKALTYTHAQENIWRRKANMSSNIQSATGVTGVLTAAVAAYQGTTGDRGASAIATNSFISALMFGYTSTSNANNRQEVYLKGAGALACVKARYAGLAISDRRYQEIENAFVTARDSRIRLRSEQRKLQSEIGRFQARYADSSIASSAVAGALVTVTEADEAIAFSNVQNQQISTLLDEVDQAGVNLVRDVETLRGQVDVEITKLQPSPTQISQVAQDIGTKATELSKLFKEPEPPTSATATEQSLFADASVAESATLSAAQQQDLAFINTLQQEVLLSVRELKDSYDGISLEVSKKSAMLAKAAEAAACNPPDALKPLKFDQSEPLNLIAGSSSEVSVTGGSGIYDISLSGQPDTVKFCEATSIKAGKRSICAGEGTAEGTFQVTAKDLINNQLATASLNVSITTNSGGADSDSDEEQPEELEDITDALAPDTNTSDSSLSGGIEDNAASPKTYYYNRVRPVSCEMSEEETAVLQLAALSSRASPRDPSGFADGVWGQKTEIAIKEYLASHGVTVGRNNSSKCAFMSHLRTKAAIGNQVISDADAIYFGTFRRVATTARVRRLLDTCANGGSTAYCVADAWNEIVSGPIQGF